MHASADDVRHMQCAMPCCADYADPTAAGARASASVDFIDWYNRRNILTTTTGIRASSGTL